METDNKRLFFYKSPSTLVEIASNKITIALWYQQIFLHNLRLLPADFVFDFDTLRMKSLPDDDSNLEHFTHLSSLKYEVEKSLNRLSIPFAMVERIKEHIVPIEKQFERWISYHHKRIFFNLNKNVVHGYLGKIVWRCDGDVDYVGTAKQLLVSPGLSEIEKYRIMCTYCLEEEIKNASPYLIDSKYDECVIFSEDPLFYYWRCYVRNELERIPLVGFESVDMRMITMESVNDVWAIEYFWNRISEEKKPNVAKELIRKRGIQYQAFVLNRLTEIQQYHVFIEMAMSIVLNFAQDEAWAESAFKTWIHVCNIMTPDQFVDLIFQLVNRAFNSSGNEYIVLLVTNIWNSAPIEFRGHTLERNKGLFVERVFNLIEQNVDGSFEFVIDILNGAPKDLKENIAQSERYMQLCENMLLHHRPALLDRFLRCCSTTDADLAEGIIRMMKRPAVQVYYVNICMDKKLDREKKIVELYLPPNARAIADYKARILSRTHGRFLYVTKLSWLRSEDDVVKAREFLTNMLSEASPAVKKKVLMSANSRTLIKSMINDGQNELLDYLLNLCLPQDEVLEFKKEFYGGEFSAKIV